MPHNSTKRERLLDWIRNGDPQDIPVLMGLHTFEVASAKLGKDQREVTWGEAIEVAEQTGTHLLACVDMPLPFRAIPFLDDIEIHEESEALPDGTPRVIRSIKTPEGTMTEVCESPRDKGEYHREFFVKDEQDMPAFAYFIRRTTEAIVRNPDIRRRVCEDIRGAKEQVRGAFPAMLWVFCPAVELTSSIYMDQVTAVYMLYDHQELVEELMQRHWEMTKVWLSLGEEADVDIYGYAVNGFEWLNPDLYERYMIPQARRINAFATAHGKLSWIHTCGRMKEIAEMGAYQRMKVDVVESLSSPPTGDIDNLAETRRQIGSGIVTRGGMNCELFYGSDLDALRKQAEYVLDSVAGYQHILGDTNPSYPSYPWETIQAVIDCVRGRDRLFE